jgi:hypothetical protein
VTELKREVYTIIPIINALANALNEETIEIDTAPMKYRRYMVLNKLYELNQGDSHSSTTITTLSEVLDIPYAITIDVLQYWINRERVKEKDLNYFITAFGIDEIQKTINHPEKATEHFPINIANYHLTISGTVYGGIQQGGKHNVQYNQSTFMGDTLNAPGGQVFQVKDHSHVDGLHVNQTINQIDKSIDLAQLASELSILREKMLAEVRELSQVISVGDVAKAEQAAKDKDPSKVAEYLKSAGKWALDTAAKVGVPLAIAAIKQATGL